jgi:hypothetical protein
MNNIYIKSLRCRLILSYTLIIINHTKIKCIKARTRRDKALPCLRRETRQCLVSTSAIEHSLKSHATITFILREFNGH